MDMSGISVHNNKNQLLTVMFLVYEGMRYVQKVRLHFIEIEKCILSSEIYMIHYAVIPLFF